MIVAIETSADVGGVALLDGEDLIAEQVIGADQRQAQNLIPALDHLLRSTGRDLGRVELIALAVGPGSFTGLRIGLSTALGLAFGQSLPIAPVSTLAALSLHAGEAERIAPMLDARREQVYAGLYASDARELQPDAAREPEKWLSEIAGPEPVTLLGPGALRYRDKIQTALGGRARILPPLLGHPRAASVGILGHRVAERGGALPAEKVELRYLRASSAQPRLAGQP